MADVFISYKREERPRCERIAEKLRALGLEVWFDAKLESGTSFDAEIEEQVNKAKAVLALWSPASVKSTWVRNEATIGQNRHVLVSVELAPCVRPIQFTNTHTEPLHSAEFSDLDPAWLAILRRIAKLTGRAQLQAYADALAGVEPPKPRAALGALVGVGFAALMIGAGGGYLAGLANAPPAAVASAEIAPEILAAGAMQGAWRLAEGGDCAAANRYELAVAGRDLRFTSANGAQQELIEVLTESGALRTSREGAISFWRLDNGQLALRIGAEGAEATMFARCAP